MSDTVERTYPTDTIKVTLKVTPEFFDESDAMDILNAQAVMSARSIFERERPNTPIVGAQVSSSRRVVHEFDPYTLAPYEEPQQYFVARVAVWYEGIDTQA